MIVKNIIKNPESLRLFTPVEISILKKQMYGIKLRQSEKNRLSRDIRKKIQVLADLSNNNEDVSLRKGQFILEKIKKVVNVILNHEKSSKIVGILLFGSHADNTATFRSDIDICVIFKNISKQDVNKFRLSILSEMDDKIDVQVFNILPKKVQYSILNNYKVLYKSNNDLILDLLKIYRKEEIVQYVKN